MEIQKARARKAILMDSVRKWDHKFQVVERFQRNRECIASLHEQQNIIQAE